MVNSVEFDYDREVSLTKGIDKYAPKVSVYQFDDTDNIQKSMSVYTDLAIYRPGETIKFAAVLYRVGTTSKTVASGEVIEVELKDANYKSVKKLKLTSDAFGRIEGEFTIPTDRMNGHLFRYAYRHHRGETDALKEGVELVLAL